VLELLDRSKEFNRGPDNTVYHKGYPICFRSAGGTPSIQVSLTRDGSRADIDVDYRSSKFPVFLVNGHLSASNSDVRASNNDDRHNNRWAGLQNWWRNLLGLPLSDETKPGALQDRVLAREPMVKGGKPEDAIYDFLNRWLVEQKANEAIAYFADDCFACMELEKGARIDRGMARFRVLEAMLDVNRRIGRVSSLSEASAGVAVNGERMKIIEQPHRSSFVLYDVREDLAEEFYCLNRLDASQVSTKALNSDAFGKYAGAIFRMKLSGQTGETIASLWRKDRDYWRMISYEVDPEFDRSRIPNLSARDATTRSLPSVRGDKDMIKAASDFFNQWFVKENIDKALEYIAPECLECSTIYLDESERAPSSEEEARALLKKGMVKAAGATGGVRDLVSAIVAPQPFHEDLKLVRHREDKAFAIVSIPKYMGEAVDCRNRGPDGEPEAKRVAATGYGEYYATGFSLGKSNASSSLLWIAWKKVNGAWKAVSYVLITP
jgi:hypothetical protein